MVCRGQPKRKKPNASGWAAALSLLIALLLCSSMHASNNKWEIKIELSKQDYMLHEPVPLEVTVTNIASNTVRTLGLIPPNHLHFRIRVTDSYGKEVRYTGPQYTLVPRGLGRLVPAGEWDYDCFNLLDLFRPRESDSGYEVLLHRFPDMPKGTYTVLAEYEGDLSNELTFNIVEPYGQEVDVLRRVEQASQIWSKADTDPSAQAFGEIARDYPNSIYAEKCWYLSKLYSHEIFSGLKDGSYDDRILKSELLSRYPNSARASALLQSILYGKSDDEKIPIYNELIERHPNTRCSKIAGLMKKRLLAEREVRE